MMTCRLVLLVVLLAAAAVTSGSPLPQYEVGDGGTEGPPETTTPGMEETTSAAPGTETPTLSTAEPTEAAGAVAETSMEPAAETMTEKSAAEMETDTGDSMAEKTASAAEKNETVPAEMTISEEGAEQTDLLESTTTGAPDTEVTDTAAPTAEEPTTEPSEALERVKEGRQTTNQPAFTDEELVPAPVCATILNASLSPPTFRRHNSNGFTTCTCANRHQALCQPETPFPTVRPGSASAVHAREQSSSSGRSPTVMAAQAAANAFALRHDCQQRAKSGAICLFGAHGDQLYCDCAVEM